MKRSYIFKALLFGLALGTTASCSEDLEKADYDKVQAKATLPTVTTGDVEVYGTAAAASFTVTPAEGTTLITQGVIVSTKKDAAIADSSNTIVKVSDITAGKPAMASITGLTAGKTYYVKAFAAVDGGIAYGDTKEIKATDDYGYVDYDGIDFTDMTAGDASKFTFTKLGSTVNPFTPVSLAALGLRQWGLTSSVFSPDLFQTGQASLASQDENNLASFAVDFTGKNFPAVTVEGLNLAAVFNSTDYIENYPGDFDVLFSTTPITSEDDLAKASVVGTCHFDKDAQSQKSQFNDVTIYIPQGTTKGYITIHNHSTYTSKGGNMGVVITAITLSSLEKKAQ